MTRMMFQSSLLKPLHTSKNTLHAHAVRNDEYVSARQISLRGNYLQSKNSAPDRQVPFHRDHLTYTTESTRIA